MRSRDANYADQLSVELERRGLKLRQGVNAFLQDVAQPVPKVTTALRRPSVDVTVVVYAQQEPTAGGVGERRDHFGEGGNLRSPFAFDGLALRLGDQGPQSIVIAEIGEP